MKTLETLSPGVCLAAVLGMVCVGHAAEKTDAPARVLMLVGGDHHDYDALPRQFAARLGQGDRLKIDITADLSRVTAAGLADYDVLFVQTCHQEKLSDAARSAIVEFAASGKGLVAMHCAFWSYQDWPEWRKLIGAFVATHDKFGPYEVTILDPAHPIVRDLDRRFTVTDEPYFVEEADPKMNVLVRTSATHKDKDGRPRPAPEPQVWTRTHGKGRVFATTFGHDAKSQDDERIVTLVRNGTLWAAGRLRAAPHNRLSAAEKKEGWQLLFNGKDLTGWKGNPAHWSVEEGELVGRSSDLPHNVFITYEREFGDFEMRYSTKIRNGNSGVQLRSQQLPEYVVAGYQADIADGWYGSLYSEKTGRGILANGWKDKGEKAAVVDGWNDMTIKALGPRIIVTLNGVTTVDFTETEANQPAGGVIALQLHKGPPMEVRFRDMRIRPLGK